MRSERGQVLIMTAACMVALLAIGAIVVDLGLSWMLRRQEQNAADPGAIAAARWLRDPITGDPVTPDQTKMNADACMYAQANGFFEGDTNCAAAIAAGDLRVVSPPISGPYSGSPGKVQVIITAEHPSFFGRILGSDTATVRTDAVASNDAANSNSSSLVALKPDCSGGASGQISGGGEVRIFPVSSAQGGYVHVNSDCGSSFDDVCTNGVGGTALHISGELTTPYAYVVGSCGYSGTGPNGLQCEPVTVTACLDEGAVPLGDPLAPLPEPPLAAFPNGVCPDGSTSTPASTSACELKGSGSGACPLVGTVRTCSLPPGVYYGGWDVKSNVRVQLQDGMYILAGGGIKLSGSSEITTVDNASGLAARITIFSTDGPGCPSIGVQCQGAITFTANQSFKARATNSTTCAASVPNICAWKGLLLWQDGSASNPDGAIKLGGSANSILSGTIYAPKADVLINGGSGTTGCDGSATASCLSIQIISWTWKIDGDALVEMPYDPSELFQLKQRGLVD
jgi:hypothetical protein